MPNKDKQKEKEYQKQYHLTHPDTRQRWKDPDQKEYQKKYKKMWNEKYPNYNKDWYQDHKEYQKDYQRKKSLEYRTLVLMHYSNGVPQCECCGELEYEFLSLDHIHGGGCKQLKELRRVGSNIYRYLVMNDFPDGYRILCMNCNHAIGRQNSDGICPHQRKKSLKLGLRNFG